MAVEFRPVEVMRACKALPPLALKEIGVNERTVVSYALSPVISVPAVVPSRPKYNSPEVFLM
jgi:hypothetical protein